MSTEPVDTARCREWPEADDVPALCDEVDRLTATLDRVRALTSPATAFVTDHGSAVWVYDLLTVLDAPSHVTLGRGQDEH